MWSFTCPFVYTVAEIGLPKCLAEPVPTDSRMTELVAPLTDPKRLIFDAERMVYGGFQPLVQSNTSEVG